MRAAGVGLAAAVAFVIAAAPAADAAWDASRPDDPAAQAAARQAVSALGPDRGARTLVSERRDIRGLQSGLVRRTEDLESAIKALRAQVRTNEILVEVSADVLFDFDRADLKPAAEDELRRLALVIEKRRKGLVIIHGHTDGKGADAYNQELSKRRADAVKSWLVANGKIPAAAIRTQGFGKSKPVAPDTNPDGSDNPDGRAKNRRVEVVIQTAEAAR